MKLTDVGLDEGEDSADEMETPCDENIGRLVDLLDPVDERRNAVENVRLLERYSVILWSVPGLEIEIKIVTNLAGQLLPSVSTTLTSGHLFRGRLVEVGVVRALVLRDLENRWTEERRVDVEVLKPWLMD